MAEEDPNEMVYITHPDVDAVGGPVSRDSLDRLWSGKGWSQASDEQATAAASGEPTQPTEPVDTEVAAPETATARRTRGGET